MKIVLFDGDCAFCNHSVLFILNHNNRSDLFVCSSQSEKGQNLIKEFNITANPEETIIFIDETKVYTFSRGVLQISKYLKGLYPLLYFFVAIPSFIRDGVYKFISKRRKTLLKNNSCSFDLAKKYSNKILD